MSRISVWCAMIVLLLTYLTVLICVTEADQGSDAARLRYLAELSSARDHSSQDFWKSSPLTGIKRASRAQYSDFDLNRDGIISPEEKDHFRYLMYGYRK